MTHDVADRSQPPRALILALWSCVILLAILGVASAIGRGIALTQSPARAAADVRPLLHALHRDDLQLESALVIRRFAAHPLLTLLHILPGGIFLTLAPFQFSARVRSRHIRFHRWSGRVLVPAALVSGVVGLYFGVLAPYAGLFEASATALFGCVFLVAITRAFVAIRRRQVARHREWMIRAFAIGIGISTIRVVGLALDAFTTVSPRAVVGLSFWSGWAITLGTAELWIRYTRPRARSLDPSLSAA